MLLGLIASCCDIVRSQSTSCQLMLTHVASCRDCLMLPHVVITRSDSRFCQRVFHSAGQQWHNTNPAAADEAEMVDALLRYHYYVEMGIDNRQVAPFREEWIGNALSMVPHEPPPNVRQVCALHKPPYSEHTTMSRRLRLQSRCRLRSGATLGSVYL